jgi:hypothetical protein
VHCGCRRPWIRCSRSKRPGRAFAPREGVRASGADIAVSIGTASGCATDVAMGGGSAVRDCAVPQSSSLQVSLSVVSSVSATSSSVARKFLPLMLSNEHSLN